MYTCFPFAYCAGELAEQDKQKYCTAMLPCGINVALVGHVEC